MKVIGVRKRGRAGLASQQVTLHTELAEKKSGELFLFGSQQPPSFYKHLTNNFTFHRNLLLIPLFKTTIITSAA